MLYFRVAFRVEQPGVPSELRIAEARAIWRWRSTILTSPHALFTLLKIYQSVPKEHIRIFFSTSEEDMEKMLLRQNRGLISSSLTAEQLLVNKKINMIEVRRLEMELSTAPGYDEPYTFSLPESPKEWSIWLKLMSKVQSGELES